MELKDKKWDVMMHFLLQELAAKKLKEKRFAGKKELDKDGDGVPKWADKDDSDSEVGSKKSSKKKGGKVPPQLKMHIKKKAKKLKIDEQLEELENLLFEEQTDAMLEDDVVMEYLTEEEAKKKKPRLGKVTRNPSGSKKKFHVYVNCGGKVKKISFGDPNLSIKRDSAARRKNFRARHKCDKAAGKDRCSARYWSCYQWRAGKKVEGEE